MIAEQNYGAHSAQVEMRLVINGQSLSITHMGPDFVLIENPPNHPPCDAEIFLQVDENRSRWRVRLPNGISAGSKRVALAIIDE